MDWEVRAAAFFLCLSIFLGTIQNGTTERKIVCYYTNWSVYRPGTAKFSPQNINPYLCTHLIYAFGGFTKDNALKPFDKYQDIEKGGYAKFTGLKTYNKDLKTMLAIGGWNEGSSRFSPMVADPARRKEFVKNSIKFLRQNHFDGLDLDWEYPASRDGGKPRDKDNYASLVQELREEFERETTKTGRTRLLLSMAVPAGIEYLDKGYDVPRLNEYLDFINLLSYDYHSVFDTAVNHHAPLYSLEEDNEYNFNSKLTIDYTINHLVQSGASPEKIVLGIPTYGRSFTLLNEDATDLGSPADGPGSKGDTTRQEGYLAYYEICEGIAESDDWEVVQPNPTAMGPYAFKDDQWVGYDDEAIVKLKARYVNEKNLGGIMFWSIDNDDFRGKCHNRPYPLIEAAKEALLTGETENSVQKTKITSGRKKNRNHGNQNNAVSRKLGSSSRRSTTVAPPPRKRISSSRPRYRTISRPKFIAEESEEDQIVERRSYDASSSFSSSQEDVVENGNTVKASEETEATRPRKRNKTRSRQSSGKRRKSSQREKEEANSSSEESLSNKLTTPEPPTTPDPGGDFKCEDEGFFSHPRDCKKYFWCLDSGPGGLGVVAHQFTCPSGLVFNKAADSCDYPRNVVCPKSKTTKTAASTTRAPITAATSRTTYLHSTTQRTTTTTSESKEEYEYYEDDYELDEEEEEQEEEEVRAKPKITSTSKPLQYKTINRSKPTSTTTSTTTTTSRPLNNDFDKIIDEEDEEDPKVIKELINLIRKAGGIEQLEKQLQIQGKSSDTTSNNDPITPATISRSLYERVLNRQASKISNSDRSTSFSTTNYQNGPGRTQFEGLDEVPEVKNLRRTQKPQYVTIERPKITTDAPEAEEEDDDNEDIYNDNKDTSSEEQAVSNLSEISSSTHRITPNYVSIRRNRLSTTTSRDENVVSENNEDNNSKRPTRRRRPVSFKRSGNEESAEDSLELEESREKLSASTQQSGIENITPTTKSRYINIQRFRSTTLKPTESYNKETDNLPVFESNNESSTTKVNADKDDEITENPNKITSTVSSTTLSTFSSSTTSSTSTTQIVDVNNQADSIKNTSIVDSIIDTTTDTSVKLVEDSATEILLTTAPAKLNQPVSTTNVVATVSQPRPFGFTRRKPTVALSDVTTPLAPSLDQPKVDSLATQRLPTLKELIGYQTDVYTTTQSSTYLNLYSIDTNGDNDFKNMEESLERNKSNFETNREYKKNEYITVLDNPNQNSRNYESWILQGLKDNINITTSEKKADGFDTILEDHFIDTNAIYDESLTNKKRKTRIDHTDSTITTLKPTTMRGTLIRTSSEKAATRGFYVTKNDSESSLMKVTVPIYLTSTNITPTESVLEREDSTTTVPLTTDPYSFSTTDEILYNAEESVSMATINDYQQNYDSVSSTTKNLKSQYDIKKSILFTESIEEPNTYNDATTLSWTERLTNSTNDRTTISLLSDSTKLTEDNFEISVNNATDMCVNSKFSMECSNINTNKNKKITEEPNIPKITVDEVMPTTVSKFTVTMKNLSDNFLQDPTITKTYWTTTDLSDHIEEVTDFEESKISDDNTFINNFSTENNINLTTDSKSLHMPEVITDTSIDNIEHTSMPPIMYTTQDDIENTTLDTVISTKEKETFQSTIKTTMENYMNDGIETSTEKDKNIEDKEIMDDTTPNSFNFMTTMTKYDIKSNSNENSATISLNVDNSYFKPTISSTLETNAVQHFNPISENINAYITSEITIQESEAITQELTLKSKEIVSESNESQTTTITLKNESMGVKKYFTKDDSSTSIDFISTPQNSINDSNFKEIVSEKGYQDVKLVTLSTKVTEIPAGIDQTLLSTLSTINNDKFTANVGRRRQKIRVNKSNYEFGRRRIPQTTEKILLETDRSYPKRRVKIFRGRQRKTNSSSSTTLKSTAVSEDNFDREKTSQKPRRIKVILKKTKIKIEEIKKEDELDGGITTNDRNFRQDIRPVAEYTERPLDEVTFSKNIGTSIRPSGNIPINRQRKPHTQTVPSTSNKLPSTVAVYRKTRPGEVTLPPTTVKIDSREETTVIPQQPVKDEDQKSEMSDQNTRAQELAVTLADPPSSQSSSSTGRQPLRNALRRKISTTVTPRTSPSQINSTTLKFSAVSRNRQRPTTKGRPIDNTSTKPRQRPVIDYDYYEDEEEPVVGKSTFNGKLFLTSKGTIRCLDQGNFPHPYSCKKFITCARMVNGQVIGAEYTCPDKLSFDPVGGICNWSAGLGCKE